MITTLLVLALTCLLDPGQESARPFEPQVEILKVEVSPPLPGNPRRRTVTVTFNLPPDFPRGIKINFELLRQGPVVGKPVQFTLENEIRKNIKVVLDPNERLTADKYCISTSLPLADQPPEVRKFLEGRPQRFPPEHQGWHYAHNAQEFVVGTPEDEAAELAEFARFAEGNIEKIIDLNNQGMDELEKVKQKGLDQEALKKFLAGWKAGMAEVQDKMKDFPDREPGLYFKFQRIHQELLELARMVSKRITRTELGNVLRKHNLTPAALKLPSVAGFDDTYRWRVSASDLEERYAKINALLYPEEAAQEGEEAEKGLEKTSGKEGSENTSEIPPGKEDDEPAGEVKKAPATSDAPPEPAKKPEKNKPKKPQKSSGKTSKKSSAKEGAK